MKPEFSIVTLHRALAYSAMGRVKDAVRESLRERPQDVGSLNGRRGLTQATFILWRSGKIHEATKLAAQVPDTCDPRISGIVLRKPTVQNNTLFAVWSTGRGGRSGRRTSYFYLAEQARLQGRTGDMLANLEQLLRSKPQWSEVEIFEDALGDAYFRLGRWEMAIREYERALRLFPGIARARYHLAQAYRHMGRNDLAKAQFRQFLDLWKHADPDLPELGEARRWAE